MTDDSPDDTYLALPRAAETIGVPITALRHWIESGRLPATTGMHGREVRLADVRHVVESLVPAQPVPADAGDPAPGNGTAAVAESTVPQASQPVIPQEALATAVEQSNGRSSTRRQVIGSSTAAFMARLDGLYRAQLEAKDGEIAAKDDLIVELRRRAERAEQQTMALERRLEASRAEIAELQGQPLQGLPSLPARRGLRGWLSALIGRQ